MCMCVCCTNWTGIAVEVKRGRLRRGCRETSGRRSGALGEQQFLTSKKAHRVDKR